MNPVVLHPNAPPRFPQPGAFDDEGLVAIGGDLSTERLLRAYEAGIFPWYSEGTPLLWWSPNPRAVLPCDGVHISRSLRRRLKKKDFRVSWNEDFAQVVRSCAVDREEGTWILPQMEQAYCNLHRLGYAHSIEVWRGPKLIGGLYGVQRGGLFAAESMFHKETDGSKIALAYAVHNLSRADVRLIDVQFLTPHLASLGARELARDAYLDQLKDAQKRDASLFRLDLRSPV